MAYDLDGMPEVRKVAILRSSLGAEGYRICMSLCPGPDLTVRQVLTRLEARFAPRVSKIYARSFFHRRSQLHIETCVQFVSQLRALLTKCDYNEHVRNELLRDRFLAGCSSDKIREKLMLEQDGITLEQCLGIANNVTRRSPAVQVGSN